MKKFGFICAAIMAAIMMSCGNGTPKADLKCEIDSLSYAIGMAQSRGLKEYLTQRMNVDTTYIDEFIKGLNESANAGVDKKKAQEWAAKLKKQYPNMPVYVHFLSPRWMTMCGNYRTHKEAEPVKTRLIQAGFKYASIVRQQIVIE